MEVHRISFAMLLELGSWASLRTEHYARHSSLYPGDYRVNNCIIIRTGQIFSQLPTCGCLWIYEVVGLYSKCFLRR